MQRLCQIGATANQALTVPVVSPEHYHGAWITPIAPSRGNYGSSGSPGSSSVHAQLRPNQPGRGRGGRFGLRFRAADDENPAGVDATALE